MCLQELPPQAVEVRRESQLVERRRNLLEIQLADVIGASMQEHLAHEPLALKRIGQVDAVRAPDQMSWGYIPPARSVHLTGSLIMIIQQDGSPVKRQAVAPD